MEDHARLTVGIEIAAAIDNIRKAAIREAL
jgi:hypothetical protein